MTRPRIASIAPDEKHWKLQAVRQCFRCSKQNRVACLQDHQNPKLQPLFPPASHFAVQRGPLQRPQNHLVKVNWLPRPSDSVPLMITASASDARPAPVYLQTYHAWVTPNGQLLVKVVLDIGSIGWTFGTTCRRHWAVPRRVLRNLTFGKIHSATSRPCNRVCHAHQPSQQQAGLH